MPSTSTSLWLALLALLCFSAAYSSSSSSNASPNDEGACAVDGPASSSSPTSSSSVLLEQILANDYEQLDAVALPHSVVALKERGAHRCWHKHSTFLDHLLGVHHTLRLWGQGAVIGRVGLFHSAYSNSYVNLALFDPVTERNTMRDLIGAEAEELVYLFCIIDRQQVVVNTLLRQGFIPEAGLYVPHLRNPDERVFLSAETLRMLVVFSMADTSEQYFFWQDELFGGGGSQGSMIIPGQDHADRHDSTTLWPGLSKPGLYLNYISDLGRVARTFRRDNDNNKNEDDPTRIFDFPPIFANCTQSISVEEEKRARDLYWSVVSGEISDDDAVIATLEACHESNPWIFEPLVMLSQKFLHRNDYDAAVAVAEQALDLQQQWGTAWDKRLSFSAWVSWTRVLHQRAQNRQPWPSNSWDVNNFGLVR